MDKIQRQLYAQRSQPQGALDRLKSMLGVRSAAGQIDLRQLYNQYVQQALSQEIEPVDFQTFMANMR